MKKPQNHPAKIIISLTIIGIAMALSLIVIPGMFGRKHDPNSSVKDKMLNIEAITEEMVRREEIRGIMSEEESEKSDTEGMQRMLEELESAK